MNKNNRFIRISIAVLLATLMAGSSAQTLMTAMEIPCGVFSAYTTGLIAAALCGIGSSSAAMAIAAYAAAAVLGGVAVMSNLGALGAIRSWISSLANPEAVLDAATLAQASGLLSIAISALLGACFYAAVSRPGSTPLALLVYFAILIASYALAESMSFGMAVPGLIGALAAFVLSLEVPRDAGAWRVLIPVSLIVAMTLVLVPGGRVTWAPLENAARAVRAVFEEYFRFTHERIPFTINTEGYNHAAEIDGEVVTQLGGPATPNTEPAMKVTADADVLLRGAIRRTYTGHSWEDPEAKARYLFYDFTRSHIREELFGMENNDAFAPVNVAVEFLGTGTSSLFVPSRLQEFTMERQNALYYNSVGEMFLSRQVEAGDVYSLIGYQPGDEEALRQAVAEAQDARDDYYSDILQSCMQLPSGIEEGVYALAIELTQELDNPYDKAMAIQSWLKNNCLYTLEPAYPSYERDFVSQFVMEGREGYCSYFASAMTVMSRIAGLPARYVEGYSVKAGDGVIVTGEDAHAWTEIYFNGIGWVAFDPSNGAEGGDDGLYNGPDNSDEEQNDPAELPTPSPSPSPTPAPDDATPPPDDGQNEPTPEPEITPTPEPDDLTWPPMESEPPEWPDQEKKDFDWLWILLIVLLILALIALAILWVRSRLMATDPIRLSAKAKTAMDASMILYRSILTLLAQMGQTPLSGETPGMFARRVCAQMENPEFVAFADEVAMIAYSRNGVSRQAIDEGRAAYQTFEKAMKKGEKLRFIATRLFRGLGEFESIP